MALAGTAAMSAKAQRDPATPTNTNTIDTAGLTRRFADFIVQTKYRDLPQDVIDLGKTSILDGVGLALVGSVVKSGQITRAYLESLGVAHGDATVVGSAVKSAPRFAAFANGIGIHAEDYDDTQLSAAPDRVYGLLTHPTAPCLSAALAAAEARGVSGGISCSPITSAWKWNTRLPKPSSPGITKTASTRPERAPRSRQQRRP